MTQTRPGLRGWPLYSRVLAAIWRQPMTAVNLAESARITVCNARFIMRRMRDLGLVHIQSWARKYHALPVAVWSFGCDADAPMPPSRKGRRINHSSTKAKRLKPRADLIAFAAMVNAMQDEPRTAKDLSEIAGTNRGYTKMTLNKMRDVGLVHIGDWERRIGAGTPSAMYQLGLDKPDVPRPKLEPRKLMLRRVRKANAARAEQVMMLRALAGVRELEAA